MNFYQKVFAILPPASGGGNAVAGRRGRFAGFPCRPPLLLRDSSFVMLRPDDAPALRPPKTQDRASAPRHSESLRDAGVFGGMGILPMVDVPIDFDRYAGRISGSEAFFGNCRGGRALRLSRMGRSTGPSGGVPPHMGRMPMPP